MKRNSPGESVKRGNVENFLSLFIPIGNRATRLITNSSRCHSFRLFFFFFLFNFTSFYFTSLLSSGTVVSLISDANKIKIVHIIRHIISYFSIDYSTRLLVEKNFASGARLFRKTLKLEYERAMIA